MHLYDQVFKLKVCDVYLCPNLNGCEILIGIPLYVVHSLQIPIIQLVSCRVHNTSPTLEQSSLTFAHYSISFNTSSIFAGYCYEQ